MGIGISIRGSAYVMRLKDLSDILMQEAKRFYNDVDSWRIQLIEDYASNIATIRNLHITIKFKEEYYQADRIFYKFLTDSQV